MNGAPASKLSAIDRWLSWGGAAVLTLAVAAAVAACAGPTAAPSPPATAAPAAASGRFVEVPGARLWVQTQGSGRPIVFLHGGLHHFDNSFALQRDDFARSRTVVGIDQRGHGRSPDDARPFAYPAMADDTAAVIRALGVGPVDIIGHSDGGDVALLLARAHPELVRRIVVSGANLRAALPPDELQRRQAWSDQRLAEFLPTFESRMPPGFRADFEAVAPDGPARWPAFLAKSYRLWLTPEVVSAADLKAIEAPVLVMAGDADFTALEETADIYRGLRKAQLFIVPGTGHGTFEARAGLVDQAIREFLDGR